MINIIAAILIVSFIVIFIKTFFGLCNNYKTNIPTHMIIYLFGGGIVFLASLLFIITNPTADIYYSMCALIISGTCICMVGVSAIK